MTSPRSKLERPPAVQNFVRYVHPTVIATAEALVDFAINTPQTTYFIGNRIVQDRILLGLDRATAEKAAETTGHVKSRQHNLDYVKAFLDYDEMRGLSRSPAFDQVVEPFRVSREVVVPVKPLVVCSEAGSLNAVFSVGWASMPLTDEQWRLRMTMVEDAVFTLTDFVKARGTFYAFPRRKASDPKSREPQVVQRGDFALLSKSDLKERLETYLAGLTLAKQMLADVKLEVESEAEKPAKDDGQLDLFS